MSSNPSIPSSNTDWGRRISSILLVNDDADTLFLMGHALKRAFPETKILTALDGREALAMWRDQGVSAIITDNRMLPMSGIALTKKIRETDSDLPVIMVTAAAEVQEEALRAGVTLFYPHTELDGLVAAVKLCLGCVYNL